MRRQSVNHRGIEHEAVRPHDGLRGIRLSALLVEIGQVGRDQPHAREFDGAVGVREGRGDQIPEAFVG